MEYAENQFSAECILLAKKLADYENKTPITRASLIVFSCIQILNFMRAYDGLDFRVDFSS